MLGIVGLLCCTIFVLSAGAVVTGFLARKQIAESQGRIKGGGMATAGLVLGGVGILLAIVYWVLFVTGVIDNNFYFDTTTYPRLIPVGLRGPASFPSGGCAAPRRPAARRRTPRSRRRRDGSATPLVG